MHYSLYSLFYWCIYVSLSLSELRVMWWSVSSLSILDVTNYSTGHNISWICFIFDMLIGPTMNFDPINYGQALSILHLLMALGILCDFLIAGQPLMVPFVPNFLPLFGIKPVMAYLCRNVFVHWLKPGCIITPWHGCLCSPSLALCVGNPLLTHLPLDKMDAISQPPFSNALSWMKNFDFWLKFHWSLFIRVQLTKTQHWFR